MYLTRKNRHWTIGVISALIVLCSTSISFYLFARDIYSELEIRQSINAGYNSHRPAGGRLSGMAYIPNETQSSDIELGRAQVFLLRHPEIKDRQKLQGMIYIATGDCRAFIETRASQGLTDVSFLNSLGVCFLSLSSADPTYLLKALDQFEKSISLDGTAQEPRFNLVLTYRRLRLPRLAADALHKYRNLDSESLWYRELTEAPEGVESSVLGELRELVSASDPAQAEELFQKNAELCRRVAMQYGLSNLQESPSLIRFIGREIEERFNDKTVSAMLAPLFTERRQIALAVRNLVTQGAQLYLQGDLQGSLDAYSKAESLVDRTDSTFDRLWIDINRVDTWIRAGEFESARKSLERAITLARENKLAWLEAKALSIYGSTLRLTTGYGQMLELLAEADRRFIAIGASNDRVRPLYYLAVYQYGAGDQDEALKLALECLQLTDEADTVRMSSLDFLIGSVLYRKGSPASAVLFEKESLDQAQRTKNPGLELVAASTLAQLYDAVADANLAQENIALAEKAFEKVPPGFEQWKAELTLGTVKARIYLHQKRYAEVESLLKKNLSLYPQQPFQVTNILSQSLMLMAKAYAETGRSKEAAQKFNEAIEIVENDDRYLETEKLRVKFDDERRELYDSAIEFEYKQGGPDTAWKYLQKYRAKLFLEFLAQFNPDIQRLRGTELSRSRVQKLVPHDTQVVEYALLKDQLLIWVISDSLFTSRSVPASRTQVESDVQQVLQKLRNDKEADRDLEHLGALLIDPIADLLDPNRTIAIIPDRALHGLPFVALRRSGKPKYLIQNFPVLVSPSLTYLLATGASQPERGSIVGFGSQFDDTSEVKELTALKTIYPSARTFSGAEVDKPRFLTAMNTAPVVHYAGHSATDAVDPLRSSILLDGNRYGPNSVTAVDISQQRLWKNAVVVLSSCDSSVGNSRDGVGMRGLTSAFLIGGAGAVVGSLWPVEASSASQLMISFHRAFAAEHMPVTKALRQAQLAFLQSFPERSHPYYWSGFEVTGNFSALR